VSAEALLHLVHDRLHLALVGRRGEDEGVGDGQPLAHVDDRDVGRQFVGGGLGGQQCGLPRLG
jgi:hypothetical protein